MLISGSGSNLQALIDSIASGDSPAQISAVISNRADAYGLQRAQAAGIATQVLDHKAFADREAFDVALIEAIDAYQADLVILAWAALRRRAWYHHGVTIDAPKPGALRDDMELREQPMPSEDEWASAIRLAGSIFGLTRSRRVRSARDRSS